jgi:amino acid transporter
MHDQGSPGLKHDALSLPEAIIMGIAGTAPAYSMAATTATLVAAIGVLAPASLSICGVAMFGVAFAFLHLTQIDPNAGAVYIWVKHFLHPVLGFFAGWTMLVMSALFMVSGTVPAATIILQMLAPGAGQNIMAVTLVAALLMILIGLVVLKGIKLSSHFQVALTLVEVTIVIGIIVAALIASSAHPVHKLTFGLLVGFDFTPRLFVSGALVAVFFYSGWDVTANLNEETRDAKRNGGLAALLAMLSLILILVGFTAACLLTLSDAEIQNAGTNVVTSVAERILPAPWGSLAILAVLLSSIGTLETNVLQFTRTLFAMARDGVFPERYARVHAVHQTPWISTVLVTAIGLVLLLLSSALSSVATIMKDFANALGFQIAFYYALACLACAWCMRKNFHMPRILLTGILWPLVSAIFLIVVALCSIPTFDATTLLVSLGSLASGILPLALCRLQTPRSAERRDTF